jgi:transposase
MAAYMLTGMGQTAKKLQLRRGDRKILEKWVRSRTLPRRQVDRAKILLGAARGLSSRELARSVDVARDTARLWVRRYESGGLDAVAQDRPRSGRPRKLTPELEAEIVDKTIHEDPPPEVSTHWTSRLLADAMGLNHVDVWRTWKKYGLKPHQIRRFKLSRDPRLVEKIHDVVGVYLHPPANAVVFSFDEKSQIQALDRTQPGLPLKRGRAGTMTHDYKRHGTTTLFAALEVASGDVIHQCMPRHRHQEFLKFMKTVVEGVEPGLDVHVILDNYATHKHEKVRRWLERNDHVHFHFVPTGASWLNLVERFFSELTERQLRRLAVTSVPELISAIDAYITHRNEDPTPFVWTKSAKDIIQKIQRGLTTLEAVH